MAKQKSGWRTYRNAQLVSQKMLAGLSALELKIQAALSREDYVEAAKLCLQLHTANENFRDHTDNLAAVNAAYRKAEKKSLETLG